MTKKTILSFIILSTIIAIIHGLWIIQPMLFDEWDVSKPHTFFIAHPFPKTGQEIRYYFSSWYFLPTNPFSFYRPWSFFTAIFLTSLFWVAFIKEPIFVRAWLTLLVLLGFPYLGHIGPWNIAASMYTVSVVWMMIWYAVFINIRYVNMPFILKGILFFILTFIAASWHEVWLITFAGIVGYFIFDAFSLLKRRRQFFKIKSSGIYLSVIAAYILAVAFYTRGGPSKFIDKRMYCMPGHFTTLFNWPHIIKAFLLGTKESLVLFKDSIPVFLLIVYLKLNKNFKTKLNADFKLFVAAALGSILFIYVGAFIFGAVDWRTRWLCVLSLSVAFYAFPQAILINRFSFMRSQSFIKTVRFFSVIVVVIWLSYNAFFTYIYTNIDVIKWLRYRQMVLDHNPDVLKGLGHCTLPKNRPKGVATLDHAWGYQDDRYRIFIGPAEKVAVFPSIKAFWEKKAWPEKTDL